MKYLLSITLFLFLISDCRADVPPGIKQRFREIIRLIKADKVNELSWMVAYPLTRENPMPDIVDAKAFIAHYPVLFDKAFKKKLLTYNDSIVFEHHGTYGLVGGIFDGDIWINQEGKIAAVNYSSVRENELRNQLTKEIQSKIYP